MALAIQHSNGPLPQAANCTLTGSIAASGGGTVTVSSATYLPTLGPFTIVVDNERILIDSISGTTLTYSAGGRGQEGTSAAAHSSGANVYQVLTEANLRRVVDDRTGVVLAPDPTGTAATDKTNLDALTSVAGSVIQLRPGTYVCNPLATTATGVILRGWPGLGTTLKLAVQSNYQLIQLGQDARIEGCVLDGDKTNQTFTANVWEYLVKLSNGAGVRDCKIQNVKDSAVGATGTGQIQVPLWRSLTTSTSGGSLAATTAWYYRITATNASGETVGSQERTVTTGAGATNSNTLTWYAVTGATGYKIYAASGASGSFNETALATIGSGATVTYTHTSATPSGSGPPVIDTSGTHVTDLEVVGCRFTNVGMSGFFTENSVGKVRVHRNKFDLMLGNCVKIKGGNVETTYSTEYDVKITDNFMDYSGVQVTSPSILAIECWNNLRGVLVQGNHIISPKGPPSATDDFYGISIDRCPRSTVQGNVVRKADENGTDLCIWAGIELAGSAHCTVTGNEIYGCKWGMSISSVIPSSVNASRVDQATIVGNVFKSCNRAAIQATDGSGHVISGNTFIDCGTRYVFLNGLANNVLACSVTGNTFFIASNDVSALDGGNLYAIYVVNAGRQVISGNVVGPLPPAATPAAPTVTPQGTPGSTTYTYTITAVSEYGETVASPTGSTATGNATLNGSNFNRITWTSITGALGYRIYRTVGGATQGLIGFLANVASPSFDDTGLTASGASPSTDTSGGTSTVGLQGLYFQGTALVEASTITGNRFDGNPASGTTKPGYAITFDGPIDSTQVTGNFASNYASGFMQTTGTASTNPNFIQFNLAPGLTLPHVQGSGPKFSDVVRRSEEVQRAGGGMYLVDDFTGGLTTTGNIGALGWQFLNGTTPSAQASVASHPGILRLDSSATSGTRQYLWVGASATVGQVLPADYFQMIVMFRITQTDANTVMRLGLGNSANADPPADGIFIEKLLADTQWFGVTRASSSQTRTAALATVSAAAWVKANIRRVTSTTIGFSISSSFAPDNGTEATLTATIPTTALVPYLMVGTGTTASKTADIDYVELNVQNMSR